MGCLVWRRPHTHSQQAPRRAGAPSWLSTSGIAAQRQRGKGTKGKLSSVRTKSRCKAGENGQVMYVLMGKGNRTFIIEPQSSRANHCSQPFILSALQGRTLPLPCLPQVSSVLLLSLSQCHSILRGFLPLLFLELAHQVTLRVFSLVSVFVFLSQSLVTVSHLFRSFRVAFLRELPWCGLVAGGVRPILQPIAAMARV